MNVAINITQQYRLSNKFVLRVAGVGEMLS